MVNETEVDVFLEFSCFLYDPTDVGSSISGSSAFSKPSLDIWKFLAHVMLKPSMQDFKHDLTSMGASQVVLVVKYPPANAADARDHGLIPQLRRSLREGNGNPLQYSCLEKSHGQRSLVRYSPWSCRVIYD